MRQYLETDIPLTIMKNAFYFTLKAFFYSQDIQIFVLIIWSCSLIRKIRLFSKFMTSQPAKQSKN